MSSGHYESAVLHFAMTSSPDVEAARKHVQFRDSRLASPAAQAPRQDTLIRSSRCQSQGHSRPHPPLRVAPRIAEMEPVGAVNVPG